MSSTLLTRSPVRLDGEEPGAEAAPSPAPAGQPVRPALTAGEVAVGGVAILVGLVAWAALALAQLGAYRLWAALGLAAAAAVLLGVVVARAAPRPLLVADPKELGVLVAVAVVAAWLTFPGFPYGVADKDPGVYAAHGVSIARTGADDLDDPVPELVPDFRPTSPNARMVGVWFERAADGHVRTYVQFYHLWPAALAVAWSVGELTGHPTGAAVNLDPLLGVLAVLVFTLVVRRAFGLLTGSVAGLLLAVNLIQVWQARYPTAEVLTELLVLTCILGVVLALRTGWRPAAGLAGLALGLGFLARADTLLLLLLAVGVGAILIALGRFDARAAWFAAGLGLTLPHGLLQAYDLAASYSRANSVPSLPVLAGAAAATLLAALVLRGAARPLGDRVAALLADRRLQFRVGLALTAVAAVAMLVGFLRPWLFGPAFGDYNGRLVRTYDEQTLRRLSWFFTLPGMALLAGGLALVALRRWRAAAWAAVLPMLVSLPVYAVTASNSSRLLWWNRRFVPVVAPGIIALIAVALVAGLLASGRLRLPVRALAVACTLALLVAFAARSVPLRGHQEFAGSYAITERLAAVPGDRQGVFLFGPTVDLDLSAASAFGTPLWLRHGAIVGLLRVGHGNEILPANVEHVRAWQRAFPSQPVYVVTQGEAPPAPLQSLGLVRRERISARLPMWQEADIKVPSAAQTTAVDLSVWEVMSGH